MSSLQCHALLFAKYDFCVFCLQVQNLEYCAEPITEPRDPTIWQGDYHFAAPEVLGQGLYLKVSCMLGSKWLLLQFPKPVRWK